MDTELDHYQTLGARLARENHSLRRGYSKADKKVAHYERAILKHALGLCDCVSERECLVRLTARIPQRRYEEVR